MQLLFNSKKATQAACHLIKLAGGRINYTVLLKLLYLADREALDKYGMSITTDAVFSMKSGMVLSHTYNLIKNDSRDDELLEYWRSFVQSASLTEVSLKSESPEDELSNVELQILDSVFREKHTLGLKLIAFHHSLPEWIDPGSSSIPISISEILQALKKTPDQIVEIEKLISISNLHSKLAFDA